MTNLSVPYNLTYSLIQSCQTLLEMSRLDRWTPSAEFLYPTVSQLEWLVVLAHSCSPQVLTKIAPRKDFTWNCPGPQRDARRGEGPYRKNRRVSIQQSKDMASSENKNLRINESSPNSAGSVPVNLFCCRSSSAAANTCGKKMP